MTINNIGLNDTNWWSSGNNSSIGAKEALNLSNLMGQNTASTSESFRDSLIGLKSSADILSQSLNFMRGIGKQNTDSPFLSKQAVSKDEELLEIISTGNSRLNQANNDFSVEINQIAKAQQNEGESFKSTELATDAGFQVGENSISITAGNKQYDFNFTVSSTDTAKDVQQKIAKAINSRNISVSASVVAGEKSGTSQLVLQSRETGVDKEGQPNFTVSGNAADTLGINVISQEAQNAEFRVNRGFTGSLRTSKSNEVDLGYGIKGNLVAEGNVDVTMERNETGQINSFRHMVNSYNDLLSSARESSGGGVSRLERELSRMARTSSASLKQIGININSDGSMTIDEDRMNKAAEKGDLERFVSRGDSSSSFINRLTKTADNVNRNPASYVQQNQLQNNGITFNPNQINQLNRIMNMGLLFDMKM